MGVRLAQLMGIYGLINTQLVGPCGQVWVSSGFIHMGVRTNEMGRSMGEDSPV